MDIGDSAPYDQAKIDLCSLGGSSGFKCGVVAVVGTGGVPMSTQSEAGDSPHWPAAPALRVPDGSSKLHSMSESTVGKWRHLAPKPGSVYKQLFVKGTRIMARVLYGMHVSDEQPRSHEEIAAIFGLPVEAVQEAIAYCAANPPEIHEDWEQEEASDRARRSASHEIGAGPVH